MAFGRLLEGRKLYTVLFCSLCLHFIVSAAFFSELWLLFREKGEREKKIETLSLHWLTRVMGNSVSETQEARREESSGLVGVDCPPSPPTGSSQQP